MNWFTRTKTRKDAAARLYDIAAANARDPVFYEQLGVADTIDGRFDVLTLYVVLMMDRLNMLGPEGRKLAQALFDRMFRMMDLNLREMGIGDMGIPKHMKKMMAAFNGRAHSYHEALQDRSIEALTRAVSRNVYRIEGEVVPAGAQALAEHIVDVHEAFMTFNLDAFTGNTFWLPPITRERKEAAIA